MTEAETARLRESRDAWEKVAREAQADYEVAEAQVRELRATLESVREYVQDTGRAGWYDEGGCDATLAEIDAALAPKEPSDG